MYNFKGKWICDPRFSELEPINVFHKECDTSFQWEHPKNLQHVHMLVRYEFEYDPGSAEEVRLIFSADDFCKIRINGQTLAYGPSQGYYFHYYYNSIDIKKALVSGTNRIEADVLYQGLINRYLVSGDLRMGFIADVIGIRDGKEELICCTGNTGWQYAISKAYTSMTTFGYETQFAEDYDTRLEPKEEDYRDCVCKVTDHVLAEEAVSVQIYEMLVGQGEKLAGGGFFYDLGQEVAGCLKIRAKGRDGGTVRILCGEECDDSPERTRYHMRCNCDYEEVWTLAEGECLLEQFDYKAFRYFTLIPENAEILEVSVLVRHYPLRDEDCVLESNDRILESVFSICKNAVKYGSQESLLDCPSREKGAYADDLTVITPSSLWVTGDPRLVKKAIENQMQSSFVCPGLLSIAPCSRMQEIADSSLEFPLHALKYYTMTGDREFLHKTYAACLGIREYFRKYERADGMLVNVNEKGNMVDWPHNYLDGYEAEALSANATDGVGVKAHNVLNALYIGFLMKTAEMAEILGEDPGICIERYVRTFNEIFLAEDTGLYIDSEGSSHSALHSNVFPLFFGITPLEHRDRAADFIVQKKLSCGVYVAYFLLKALAFHGRYEDVYRILTLQEEHSWYNMVREGATTCYEAWGKDQKWNTSLCHPFASAPISVLMEDILGLSLDGSRGEAHVPEDVSIKVRTPMHGELTF